MVQGKLRLTGLKLQVQTRVDLLLVSRWCMLEVVSSCFVYFSVDETLYIGKANSPTAIFRLFVYKKDYFFRLKL
jgi:hypothetical protein